MKRPISSSTAAPKPLFANWRRVASRIRRADRVALFLDFDGTLAGFRKNPAEVRLDPSTRARLEALADNPKLVLAFVSGRRRADLRQLVGIKKALYLGLHGFQKTAASKVCAHSRRAVLLAHRQIAARINGLPGVQIEDKGASLVVRYRGAPAAAAAKARLAARNALRIPGIGLKVLQGKQIVELLVPEVTGKGKAAREILEGVAPGALPVYVGDDRTDETAFHELRDGVTIKVGTNRRTRAAYWVRDPGEVSIFLGRLASILES